MRRATVIVLVITSLAITAMSQLGAQTKEGNLTVANAIWPFTEEDTRLDIISPAAIPPGTDLGHLNRPNGTSVATVSVVDDTECDPIRRDTGLAGTESLCLLISGLPSATAAKATLPLGDAAILNLTVNTYHPPLIAILVATASFIAGVLAAYEINIRRTARVKSKRLSDAVAAAKGASIEGVDAWLRRAPTTLDEDKRAELIEGAVANLPTDAANHKAALTNSLASLKLHTQVVDQARKAPNIQAAESVATDPTLRLSDHMNWKGEPVEHPAKPWRKLIHNAELVAARLDALAQLAKDITDPTAKAKASNAHAVFLGQFQRLTFRAPGGTAERQLTPIQNSIDSVITEYAQEVNLAAVTGAVSPSVTGTTTPASPRLGRSFTALAAGVVGVVLLAQVVLNTGFGDTFGAPLDYLTLTVTAIIAGAGAQLLLAVWTPG